MSENDEVEGVVKAISRHTKKRVAIEFGVVPVRLSDVPDRFLHMVVVRGFGQKPRRVTRCRSTRSSG